MKQTIIKFERVGDCPHWNSGGCSNMDREDATCKTNIWHLPPENCPCEEVVE